jgi:hypothetical protein
MDKTGTAVAAKQLRSFGLLVGGIFLVIGLWPLVFRGEPFRVWACVLACVLILPALVWPRSLGPIYRGWMAIGAVLGWINTRIILSLIFYVIFTPIGFFRRVILKRDALQRTLDPDAQTYRVVREPRPSSHLQRQF